ncbi:hypothetical protein Van01_24730 [Micromonospora andamanensis]|uniref:Uncharacterized protein n=1 Tax=Micromonospora andamanensis TaxID=1287068 RepID=A0ABQ4HUE5_9ACTN|nr:hypothetical protein Van01_24730 [Micromonospora andamanensis]
MSRTDRAVPVCPGPAGQVTAAGPGRRLDLPRGGRLDGPLTGHRGLATARPDGRGIVLRALRHPTRGRLDRMRQAGRPAVVLGEGRLLVRARSARLPLGTAVVGLPVRHRRLLTLALTRRCPPDVPCHRTGRI